ncbi:hypothetical protein Fmac_007996 [Flemingia macrophylla]|uniref:Uncharacterized protein n=1 Tax=Flemingia macrophylla TaxID=520843 RepID=A0ABD1MW77_9FABA
MGHVSLALVSPSSPTQIGGLEPCNLKAHMRRRFLVGGAALPDEAVSELTGANCQLDQNLASPLRVEQ